MTEEFIFEAFGTTTTFKISPISSGSPKAYLSGFALKTTFTVSLPSKRQNKESMRVGERPALDLEDRVCLCETVRFQMCLHIGTCRHTHNGMKEHENKTVCLASRHTGEIPPHTISGTEIRFHRLCSRAFQTLPSILG